MVAWAENSLSCQEDTMVRSWGAHVNIPPYRIYMLVLVIPILCVKKHKFRPFKKHKKSYGLHEFLSDKGISETVPDRHAHRAVSFGQSFNRDFPLRGPALAVSSQQWNLTREPGLMLTPELTNSSLASQLEQGSPGGCHTSACLCGCWGYKLSRPYACAQVFCPSSPLSPCLHFYFHVMIFGNPQDILYRSN